MKKALSATFVFLLTALALLPFGVKGVHLPRGEMDSAGEAAPKTYHGSKVPPKPADAVCGSCHQGAVHRSATKVRGFLNLHTPAIDCLSCHGEGQNLTHRRNGDSTVLTLLGGAVPSAPKVEGKAHIFSGLEFVPRPKDCRVCHKRNSSFLSAPGLYEPYRRSLLEELDVLGVWEP